MAELGFVAVVRVNSLYLESQSLTGTLFVPAGDAPGHRAMLIRL